MMNPIQFSTILISMAFLLFFNGCIPTTTSQEPITIMSINIRLDTDRDSLNRWELRKESMVNLLKREQPAVIGLQEALYHQLLYLDSALANHISIGVGRDDGKTKGEFSSLLVDTTIFSIDKHLTFWLSESGDTGSIGWDAAITRVCTAGLLTHHGSGKKMWVFNSHFDHMGVTARTNSAKLIVGKMKELNTSNYPVVVMGDFNSTPETEAYSVLSEVFSDGLKIAESNATGPIGTFNGFDENNPLSDRIDYIFVKNLTIKSYTHLNDRRPDGLFITDHLPVVAKIHIQ